MTELFSFSSGFSLLFLLSISVPIYYTFATIALFYSFFYSVSHLGLRVKDGYGLISFFAFYILFDCIASVVKNDYIVVIETLT